MSAHILPMSTLEPQQYVALYLTNPLLLAAHPARMRATAEAWAAGGYDEAATAALAKTLHEQRQKLVLRTAVEASQPKAERELLDLAAHPRIAKDERTRLQEKIMGSRPSEYAWLKSILEAAILELAEARDSQVLESQPVASPRRLDVALAAARGLVMPASQLAA